MNSVKIVEEFWERVWKARNPAAIPACKQQLFDGLALQTKFMQWYMP